MHLLKQFKTVGITVYVCMALVWFCCAAGAADQDDDYEMIKLGVTEISVKGGNYGCVGAAAANVLGNWATGAGSNLFPNSSDLTNPSAQDVQELLISLSANMQTRTDGFTAWYNIASGIRKTLQEYDVEGTVDLQVCTWDRAKREIDANRPFLAGNALNPNSVYFRHMVCVIGYVIYLFPESATEQNSLLFHDGYGEGETDFSPADEAREEFWLPSVYSSFYNPWFMCTVTLKEAALAVQLADLTAVASSALQVGQEATVAITCRTQGAEKVSIDLRSVGGASNAELTKTGPYPDDDDWDSWEGQFSVMPDVSGSREIVVLATGASDLAETTTLTVAEGPDLVTLCDASEYIAYTWDESYVNSKSCMDLVHVYYDGPDDDSSKQFAVVCKYVYPELGDINYSVYTSTTSILGPGSGNDEMGFMNIYRNTNPLAGLSGIFMRDECKPIQADPGAYPGLNFIEVTRPCSGLGF